MMLLGQLTTARGHLGEVPLVLEEGRNVDEGVVPHLTAMHQGRQKPQELPSLLEGGTVASVGSASRTAVGGVVEEDPAQEALVADE